MNNLPKVAYFCMEYGLENSFKQYAGGLGILAGDYLKGAKDYNYPIVGIGILWKQGYTDQEVNLEGIPYDSYYNYKYDFLKDTGIIVTVKIRQRDVKCKVWKIDSFGNSPLYLLDTDLKENEGDDRWITGQLYGWFGEERIAQEMVLGIGGIRALRALGIDIDIYHFNEGHPIFAGFELIKEKMYEGLSFNEALIISKEEIVFTTHTPILQGNESHYINRLIYMGANNGLTIEHLVKLGGSPFNMTVAALRLSKIANAVSQLHSKTANNMWDNIKGKCKIIGITNAIHLPTWVDLEILNVFQEDHSLWNLHMRNKEILIEFIQNRNGITLDKNKLLIGFSRRAAPYKRSDFIFGSKNIISPLLEKGIVQLVFSGKAHPLDDDGKKIVAKLYQISKEYPNSVVFLENYDMNIGALLTKGTDVWLNNPRRPKEASGTSGMKAAMNGVLNLSILDGWWPEVCKHGINGWQFGDGFESESILESDSHDIKALYKVLLDDVIPTYYDNRKKWIMMMRESILSTKEQFNIKRMLEEYYERLYK